MTTFLILEIENDNGENGYVIARDSSPIDIPPTYLCLADKRQIWTDDLQKAIVYETKDQAERFRCHEEYKHLSAKANRWRLVEAEPINGPVPG